MTRYAVVRSAWTRREAEVYLPENYRVLGAFEERAAKGWQTSYVIAGEDVAGWTLDEYVIPRCASGLIQVTELKDEVPA